MVRCKLLSAMTQKGYLKAVCVGGAHFSKEWEARYINKYLTRNNIFTGSYQNLSAVALKTFSRSLSELSELNELRLTTVYFLEIFIGL